MARVAAVQFDPRIGDTSGNLAFVESEMSRLANEGVQLAVFPECALSGYIYESADEALAIAETIPGPATDRLSQVASRHGIYAVVGLLERVGDRTFNAAVLVGPDGVDAVYRKTHTLCLGVDRFATPGDIPYRVHELPFGRIGILICYDLRFPEPARVLALEGAQILCLPTNWPFTSTAHPELFTRTRAAENVVFVVAADRIGEERGARFLGRSQIVGPDGTVLAEGSTDSPETLVRDVDPTEADIKHRVLQPGIHEYDYVRDRRPDLYDRLGRPVGVP